jgi:hypothetical protein
MRFQIRKEFEERNWVLLIKDLHLLLKCKSIKQKIIEIKDR